VNEKDKQGCTSLHMAEHQGHVAVIRALIGADRCKNMRMALLRLILPSK
ncbi:hypothetical protein, partial [Candidatus Cardinium sp. cBcalN1]